jgi:hypothetical protein
VRIGCSLHFVTLGEQEALAEGGYAGVPDPLRARLQRRSHLNWNKWIRQIHRWVSIAFTVTVIANFVALAQGGGMPPPWVTYSPLIPLALLLFTGLYMFVLPYATTWRRERRTD